MKHPTTSEANVASTETQFVPSANGHQAETLRRSAIPGQCKFDGSDYPNWLGFDPYKTPDEPFAFPMPTADGDPWEHTSNLVKRHDDSMCDAWVDEIQYILIFAGLFSALVTAFAVETQKLLQIDPAVTSVLLLSQLTNHLISTNSTQAIPSLPIFQETSTSTQSLRINIFIFTSLILSLGTALVGIIALQWIRSYRKMDVLSHQDQLCVRQSRYEGLVKWKVPELISFLPIFLQTSLVVFFAGLIDFLHTLNDKVAIIIASFIGAILLGVTFTTVLPGLYILFFYKRGQTSPLPPYQSPQAWLFYRSLSFFVSSVLRKSHRQWHSWNAHPSWTQLIKAYDNSLHHWLKSSLLWVFRHLSHEDSFAMAYQCFKSLADKEMAQSLVLEHLTPSHLKRLHSRLTVSSPIAAEHIPSILLLRWDKHRRPLHQKVHLHVMELSLRCIGLDRPSDALLTTGTDPNRFLDLMYPLLVRKAGNGPQVIAESKTCVFLTLTLMNQERESDGGLSHDSRSYRWYIFWTCIIRLQCYNCSDVVDDALQVLTIRVASASPDDKAYQNILAKCCEGLFGSPTDRQEEKPIMEALFRRDSFLNFLNHFCNESDFRHGIWNDALQYTSDQRRKRWDRLLVDLRLDQKYWVIAHDPTSFQQLYPDLDNVQSSRHSSRHDEQSHHIPSLHTSRLNVIIPRTPRFLFPLTSFQRRFKSTSFTGQSSIVQAQISGGQSSLLADFSDTPLPGQYEHPGHGTTELVQPDTNSGAITIVVERPQHTGAEADSTQSMLLQQRVSTTHSSTPASLRSSVSSLSSMERPELPDQQNIRWESPQNLRTSDPLHGSIP